MSGEQQVNDGSQPGVLGDGTEEQNLGQPGHLEDRISEDEVREAFGGDDADIDDEDEDLEDDEDEHDEDDQDEDEDEEDDED